MRTYRSWSDESNSMLREMFAADCTVQEMASVLNRPKAQIY